jgi:surfactin synthase thioesterase subunit
VTRPALRRLSPTAGSAEDGYPVVCFPHAGGAASAFRLVASYAPDLQIWAVQYPCRDDRFNEPHPGGIDALAAEAVVEIRDELLGDGAVSSYALLGASLGGLVALEAARQLGATAAAMPDALVVLGARPLSASQGGTSLLTSESAMLDFVAQAGSTPAPLLADAEAREHYLSILRQDLEAVNRYAAPRPEPLPISMVILCGREDRFVHLGAAMTAWQAWSALPVIGQSVPGGHLFHTEPAGAQELVDLLRRHFPPGYRSTHR